MAVCAVCKVESDTVKWRESANAQVCDGCSTVFQTTDNIIDDGMGCG